MNERAPVVFIMGPTASGKTALAVELCRRLPAAIVSVDSAMIYRGMDIGTAKPGPEILKVAPHRLIDICDATEVYSAGRFRLDALREIRDIQANGMLPVLVGGTGLYFRALQQGISDLPGADPAVRERLEREAKVIGWDSMHQRLAAIDPESAERIHPNDPQRIQRALEVYEITGKSLSEFFADGRQAALPYRLVKLIVAPAERSIIHERVKQRFMDMIELGFVDEVRSFYARDDIHASLPAMRMVGYRQIWRYLDGMISHQEMLEHAIAATRQLAKRQLTWLRSEQDGVWLDGSGSELVDKALKFLKKEPYLGTGV